MKVDIGVSKFKRAAGMSDVLRNEDETETDEIKEEQGGRHRVRLMDEETSNCPSPSIQSVYACLSSLLFSMSACLSLFLFLIFFSSLDVVQQ